jgi:UDP-N-acetylmuramoyl-tripeptide--D-alanyl-D-alanine ligase
MIKRFIIFLLTLEARVMLWRFKPTIITITGSVGKTSTKEAVATLLGEHSTVRKSPKSYNSDFGVPLAILGLESAWSSPVGWIKNLMTGFAKIISLSSYPEYLVLEMGVDRPGDLNSLLEWVHPDIAIITAIGSIPVHVEFFENPEKVAEEKSKLAQAVPENGTVILNADDKIILSMKSKTKARVITYGFGSEAVLRASGYKLLTERGKPSGITFKIDYDGKMMPIKIHGLIGIQNVYALLATASLGISRGLHLVEIAEGLARCQPLPGRLNLIDGARDTLLIDDSYNASPIAAVAALDVLASVPAKRKIAVLGDMLELGKYTADEHRKMGELAGQAADIIVGVGVRAKYMEEGALKPFHWFSNADQAGGFLKEFIVEGDVILIKGSQSMRMEKITECLMAHPEDAKDLLVRQDLYWRKH